MPFSQTDLRNTTENTLYWTWTWPGLARPRVR